MEQVEFAAMVALLNLTVEPPLLAVTDAELPQLDKDAETGSASTTLSGNVSISDVSVSAPSRSLFRIRIVNWLTCPTSIVFGEKLLLNVGGWIRSTYRVALAGVVLVIVPLSPEDDNDPAGMVLIKFPAVTEDTSTDTVHEPGVTPT